MSTICKLDPTIRRNRSDRREAVRSLQRVLPRIPTLLLRVTGAATAAALEDIRRNPRLTGAVKQAYFNRLINRLQGHEPAASEAA